MLCPPYHFLVPPDRRVLISGALATPAKHKPNGQADYENAKIGHPAPAPAPENCRPPPLNTCPALWRKMTFGATGATWTVTWISGLSARRNTARIPEVQIIKVEHKSIIASNIWVASFFQIALVFHIQQVTGHNTQVSQAII